VIAKVIGINENVSQSQTIYDPTCGSGSLLIKAADESRYGITIYGQEMDNATRALARMNMVMHGHETATILQGNTLANPLFTHEKNSDALKTFDFAVANPPFSSKAWSNGFDPLHDAYERFTDGVPPQKNGDYAFLLHILASLKSNGKGAVILPHGVLFRGNVEAEIRKNIIRRGYIKGIIGLPANLFYGTGIPACIIVLDKENAVNRRGIFMIDASKGFMKDGNKNRLRHQDIHKIVDVFNKRLELAKYSRMVAFDEIEANDFNLNIPRYIDSSEPEDIQDIEAHLLGGIPNRDIEALDKYWRVFPTLKQALFAPLEREGYSQLKIEMAQIKPTIFGHAEFVAYTQRMNTVFDSWKTEQTPKMKKIEVGSHPNILIDTISEALLQVFADTALIDKYNVYQHLMRYWSDIMQDDVYMLVADGWRANPELIPKDLLIKRYFAAEQAAIEALEAQRDDVLRQLEELDEEHGGEDGLLADAKTDKGKLTSKSIKARLKDLQNDTDAADEIKLLEAYLKLLDKTAALNKQIKDAQKTLDDQITAKYAALSDDETKTLVVDEKWLATLGAEIHSELGNVSQTLMKRIKQLAERYATPLPQLAARTQELSEKVAEHLKRMGYTWQ
jgi:type I restriction enzyme M protein